MTDCSAFLSFAQNFFVRALGVHFNLQWLLWRKNQMHQLFFSRRDLIVTMDVPVKSFSMRSSIHSKNLSNFQNLIPSNLFDLRLSVQKLPTTQPPKIMIIHLHAKIMHVGTILKGKLYHCVGTYSFLCWTWWRWDWNWWMFSRIWFFLFVSF